MFPRKKRLTRGDFSSLIGAPRASSANFLVVAPPSVRGYAVVIPKKVIKGAVGRHLVKRRVLAALRELSLPEALVVFPKSSAAEIDFEAMKAELATLVSKTNK